MILIPFIIKVRWFGKFNLLWYVLLSILDSNGRVANLRSLNHRMFGFHSRVSSVRFWLVFLFELCFNFNFCQFLICVEFVFFILLVVTIPQHPEFVMIPMIIIVFWFLGLFLTTVAIYFVWHNFVICKWGGFGIGFRILKDKAHVLVLIVPVPVLRLIPVVIKVWRTRWKTGDSWRLGLGTSEQRESILGLRLG